MNKIILNDGTEILDGIISKSFNNIFISVPGNDLVGTVITFSDSSKTASMEFFSGVDKYTYVGFTNITSANVDEISNKVDVYMSGGSTSMSHEYTVPEIYLPKEMRKGEEENGPESNSDSET